MRRLLLDISTSARWFGAAVGIVRVERELARRMPRAVSRDVAQGFVVFDTTCSAFRMVDERLASAIVDCTATIDFSPPAAPPEPPLGLAERIRLAVREGRAVAAIRRRLPGVLRLVDPVEAQPEPKAPAVEHPPPDSPHGPEAGPRRVHVGDLPLVQPQRGDTIVSCGLDWEFKDLRTIRKLKLSAGFRYVSALYDIAPIGFPHFSETGMADKLADFFGEMPWVADQLMCISAATQGAYAAHLAERRIPAPRMSVFPLGCDLPGSDAVRRELPPQLEGTTYALYVSTIEPRKNHRTLYEAWDLAMRSGRLDPAKHRLVFAGILGWSVNELYHEIIRNPATRDTVVLLGQVTDETLRALYQGCAFTVQPSHYEGFGLSLAESFAFGKPCLSSGAGALSEIGGDLAEVIHPKDVLGWSDGLVRWLTDAAARESSARRIKGVLQGAQLG